MLCTVSLAGATETVTEAGAEFERRIAVDGTELPLAGTGVTKYRVIFTVCAVALYVPEGTPKDAVLDAETPRRLEIEYFYDISAKDIIRASMEVLKDQLTDQALQARRSELERWHQAYRPVTDGDRYSMTYLPGEGTTLQFNGETLITLAGADFARTYFGIWLNSKSPLSANLRDSLLTDLAAR
jgi:hypothetical protein